MTVLVTGAAGCLGSHLVARLVDQGERVKALVHSQDGADTVRSTNVDVVVGDLRDPEVSKKAVEGVDVVYHCAARVMERGPWTEFDACNIRGTESLLIAARDAKTKRFVHVSSIGVYGAAREESHRITEAEGYDPYPWRRGFYTWSKIEADRVALRFGRQAGPPSIVVIRPGILYGPRAKPFFARVHVGWGDKLRLILGSSGYPLPMVHVERVVDALVQAGRGGGRSGEAYNVVELPKSQRDYLRFQRAESGTGPAVFYVPFFLAYQAAKLLEIVTRKRARFLSYRLQRACQSLFYDTTKAQKDLNWHPVG